MAWRGESSSQYLPAKPPECLRTLGLTVGEFSAAGVDNAHDLTGRRFSSA